IKSSSDLAIPLAAVGLFYREGYFRQRVDPNGRTQEGNPRLRPNGLPLEPPRAPSTQEPIVLVKIAEHEVKVLVRSARVGRVPLLLLDTHLPENEPAD